MEIFGRNKGDFWAESLQLIQERLPSPESYQKAIITQNLIEKGIEDDDSLEDEGGLKFDKYKYFKSNLINRIQVANELINNVPLDKLSGRNTLHGIMKGVTPVLAMKRALVLLVDFKDRVHQTEADYIRDILFSREKNSMRNYFREVSAEKMDIIGDVIDWITLGSYNEYLTPTVKKGNPYLIPNTAKIIKDAVRSMKNTGSLSRIEDIDIFILVVSGEGSIRTQKSSDISPHRGPMPSNVDFNGKRISNYIIINELPSYDIGGYCHEVAHALGLPDLYLESGYSIMVGRWCLMGAGSYNDDGRKPAHLSAWCKMKLGWADIVDINGEPHNYEINDVYGEDQIVYKLGIPDNAKKEYFLIENRKQNGFDEYLPASGILIWHINENGFYKNCPNFDLNHVSLTLKQADGKKELEKVYNSKVFLEDMNGVLGGDEGDVYPGKTNNCFFNPESNPNSNSFSGKTSEICIEFLADSKNDIVVVMGYKSIQDKEQMSYKPYYSIFDADINVLLHSSSSLTFIGSTNNHSQEFLDGFENGFKDGYALAKIRLLKD